MFVGRKQQKTRKVVETIDDALLSVAEDSSEQYMDVDLTEYSSASQPEQRSSSNDQQRLHSLSEAQTHSVSEDKAADTTDGVELPEGLVV